jgi:hypothetical protein
VAHRLSIAESSTPCQKELDSRDPGIHVEPKVANYRPIDHVGLIVKTRLRTQPDITILVADHKDVTYYVEGVFASIPVTIIPSGILDYSALLGRMAKQAMFLQPINWSMAMRIRTIGSSIIYPLIGQWN